MTALQVTIVDGHSMCQLGDYTIGVNAVPNESLSAHQTFAALGAYLATMHEATGNMLLHFQQHDTANFEAAVAAFAGCTKSFMELVSKKPDQ